MTIVSRVLLVCVLLAGFTPAYADDAPKIFHGAGLVTGVDAESGTLTIDAKAIPGFMDAMEMDYHAEPPTLAVDLRKGDSIEFDVNANTMAVIAIKKTAKP